MKLVIQIYKSMAPADVNGCVSKNTFRYKNIVLYTTNITDAMAELAEHSASLISYWGNEHNALIYISMPDIEINFHSCRPIPQIYTDSNHIVNEYLKTMGIFSMPDIGYIKKNSNDITDAITTSRLVVGNLRVSACSTGAQLKAMTHSQ